MLPLANGWQMEVDRGPGWVFVRLEGDEGNGWQGGGLAAALWNVMQQHLTNRLILEMDHVAMLRSSLLGELVMLHKRIHNNGGLLRLSGLSDSNRKVLQCSRLEDVLPVFACREAAVMGYRPHQPR
jgi:anti-anti-sigma factor